MTTVRTDVFPRTEPRKDAPRNSTRPLVVDTAVTVDPAKSKDDWFWVSGDGKEGFVHKDDLDMEGTGMSPVAGELDLLKFAQFCVDAAIVFKCNGGVLIAIASAESGGEWTGGTVKGTVDAVTGHTGPFRFSQERWNALTTAFADFVAPGQIAFPDQQCIVAAAESKRDIERLIAILARNITTRDLYLAHLFDAVAAKQIQEAPADSTIDTVLGPILSNAPKALETFLKVRQDLAMADGRPVTVKTFIANCDKILQQGLDLAAELVAQLDGEDYVEAAKVIPKKPQQSAETNTGVHIAPFNGPVISIGATELDALARVAHSEVDVFRNFGREELEGGIAAVVDTILNRVAHRRFPNSLEEVVNQPKQFSAINLPGTWKRLPAAPQSTADFIKAYIKRRTGGEKSAIRGATHFLNPTIADSSAMREWGQFVTDHPVAIYGDKDRTKPRRSVHFHGFAPGFAAAADYAIAFEGRTHHFTGEGLSRPAGSEQANTDSIVTSARREWAFWGHSIQNFVQEKRSIQHVDNEQEYARYVRDEYCASVGDTPSLSDIGDDRYFWSAVTISYMLKAAGVSTSAFKFSNSHSVFIRQAIEARKSGQKNTCFWGYRVDENEAVPEPGDLIGYPRAVGLTRLRALQFFTKTGRYNSHTDVVVDKRRGEIDVIGGNVSDSVTMKTIRIDDSGRIADPFHHWFVVLKRQDAPVA